MKPIRLHVENFRSFRSPRDLEFDGLTIFGIVGDTGVGKTSILEAITFALYNRCTWHGSAVRDLISKGARAMTVEFVFEVDGHEYTVLRRTTQRDSQARLQCPSKGIDVSNADPVSVEIARALHMDANTFLHTVLLPQGKHSELLTKSNKERNDILTDLFRLQDLSEALERAKRYEARASTGLRMLRSQRLDCGQDPAEAAEHAKKSLAAAEQMLARAAKAVADDEKIVGELAAIEANAKELSDILTVLAGAETVLADLEKIEQVAIASKDLLGKRRAEAEAAKNASEEAEAAAGSRLEAGMDVDALRRVATLLGDLTHELHSVAEQRRRQAEYDKKTKDETKRLGAIRDSVEKARGGRHTLLGSVKKIEADIRSHEDAREKLGSAVARIAEIQETHDESARAVADTSAKIVALTAQLKTAKGGVEKANAAFQASEIKLERARMDNGVALIAGHLHAGDDCPVCQRQLPKGFAAPKSMDLARAEKDVATSRTSLEKTQRTANTIEGKLDTLPAQLLREKKALATTGAALKKAQSLLDSLLPSDSDKPEKALTVFKRELAKAGDDLQTARDELGKIEALLAKLGTDEGSAVANIQSSEREIKTCLDAIKASERRCSTIRESLPSAYLPGNDGAALKAMVEKIGSDIVDAEVVRDRVTATAKMAAATGLALRDAENAYTTEVREPRARMFERLNVVAKAAGCAAGPQDAKRQDDWAKKVGDTAQAMHRKVFDERAKAHERLSALSEARAKIRGDLGGEPRAAQNLATVDKTRAEEQLSAATANVAKALELDVRVGQMEQIQMALNGLKEALGGRDWAFPTYVTQRKQQRPIEEASIILSEMSNGRYLFAKDFDIIDSESNETRPSQTLSGGEKFLASLALSLAVVEIASSSGSRIESVFLDEGFDALDAHKLELAMLELRRRARAGRMIGVVTHIHEVAKFVNDTIVVSESPEGSILTRAGGVEDDDEIAEGLVSRLAE